MYSVDDTIATIATSIGHSGIGIIKLSGPESYEIAWRIFHPFKNLTALKPYCLHYGQIVTLDEPEQVLDEALVVYMPHPNSYTRQDVIEIQAHGSLVALQQILQLTLQLGARLAENGEMTLRAFLNGRLDLAQAEAILDVIEAKTDAALRVANKQLGGALSSQIALVRQKLLETLAFLEASIDFVEDDIPLEDVIAPLTKVITDLEVLCNAADHGQIYRQGIHVAIVGRPNVGKSSLLNALLRDNRAIVTNIAGTTRDTLEETINLNGIPVILVDTAGIRSETADEVERIGIERSQAAINQADMVLMVVDGSQPLEPGDWLIARLVRNKSTLLLINKVDLPTSKALTIPTDFLTGIAQHQISALVGHGIDNLEEAMINHIMGGTVTVADTPLVSNPRHKALLYQTIEATQAAITAQQSGLSPDLVSIDVRMAVDSLGEITGETATEDLLDTIFSRFCIGK